jgi:putative flippase GtrA
VIASGIGSFFGACVSFSLGRNWAFRRKDGKMSHQAIKYLITSGTSLVLNTLGIYLLTEWTGLDPKISKVLISILVGIFFNFLMYRYFVYK